MRLQTRVLWKRVRGPRSSCAVSIRLDRNFAAIVDSAFAQQASSGKGGFTLVELIVGLALLALLISLILPAVQMVRERSRSFVCTSNLRQLGLATQSYHAEFDCLPVGEQAYVPLLPYLGEESYFNQIQGNDGGVFHPGKYLAVLNCPSDSGKRISPVEASYQLNEGSQFRDPVPNGIRELKLYSTEFTRFRDITDGLSQTAYFSENLKRWFNPTQSEIDSLPRRFIWETEQFTRNLDDFSKQCANHRTIVWWNAYTYGQIQAKGIPSPGYDHLMTPNSYPCYNGPVEPGTSVWPEWGSQPATSSHPGGVNVLMADGSVRFHSDLIDVSVWRALGSRNGNDNAATE